MKKYLVNASLAMMLGAMVVSCSSEEGYTTLEEAKKAEYADVFKSTFGNISRTQDWGFGTSTRAITRTVVKKDMTDFPTTGVPADITDAEREYVTKWFQENPGLSEVGKDWKNFYIQWVSGDCANKSGVWHRYDQNRFANTGLPNNWDEDFTDNGGMDYLIVSDNNGYNEHVLDFNDKSGGPWGIVYMQNSSALYFGYHSSWDSNDYQYFKLAEIDVPGVGKGWYVGLSLYGKKYDNGDKELGLQRLQYAEDWILKVVPGEGEIDEVKESGRVFCEDLGSIGDFDFNDVVFDAWIYESGKIEIELLAAGGELPLTVAGVNVNDKMGKMVNTGLTEVPTYKFTIEANEDGTPKYATIKDIPIKVRQVYADLIEEIELEAREGEAPQKICLPVGTEWADEYVNINKAYPQFNAWVNGTATRAQVVANKVEKFVDLDLTNNNVTVAE